MSFIEKSNSLFLYPCYTTLSDIMFGASFHFTLSSKDKQILVVSGHEYYLKRKNKCRATAITDRENFIEMRGEHNHDISTGEPDARLVLKNIKDLSGSNIPTVATAIQPITDDIATQLALPTKEYLVRTAQRERKQREEVLPVSPATRSFEIPEHFKKILRFDSGMRHHRVYPEQQMMQGAGIMAYSHTSLDRIPVNGK